MLEDCTRADIPLSLNGDLVLQIRAYRTDIANCNADKASLRLWVKEMETKN